MSVKTVLAQTFRPYKVDLYGLQDNYITTLQSYKDNFIGQIQSPELKISDDGDWSFTCNVPEFYINPVSNKRISNPRWKDINDGTIATNTCILKIFIEFPDKTVMYPFIINKIKKKRDKNFASYKELTCSSLQFAELGKIGYKIEFSQDTIIDALEEDPELKTTLQYWLDQVFPNEKNSQGNVTRWLTPWCYEIRMNWDGYDNADERLTTEMYEEPYVDSWVSNDSTQTIDPQSVTFNKIKERIIEASKSNKYNLVQTIAEKFQVFVTYEYNYDISGKFSGQYIDGNGKLWTDRKVILTNRAINPENPIVYNYQHNLQKLSVESDSENLYTKMFVVPQESQDSPNGQINIADANCNPLMTDYILNFDYLESIGGITPYQKQLIKEFEYTIRNYQIRLRAFTNKLDPLRAEIDVDIKGKLNSINNQIFSANEQLVHYATLLEDSDIRQPIHRSIENGNAVFMTFTHAPEYDAVDQYGTSSSYLVARITLEGASTSGIVGYNNAAGETEIFENPSIFTGTPFNEGVRVMVDEYGYAIGLIARVDDEDFPISGAIVYTNLYYLPQNKYEDIYNSFSNTIASLEEQKAVQEALKEAKEEEYEALLNAYEEELESKQQYEYSFERQMGSALREGYWIPKDYEDPTEKHNAYINKTTSEVPSGAQLILDTTLEDDEEHGYYWKTQSGTQVKQYYPIIVFNSSSITTKRIYLAKKNYATAGEVVLPAGKYYFISLAKKYYFELAKETLYMIIRIATPFNPTIPFILTAYYSDGTYEMPTISLTTNPRAQNITSIFAGISSANPIITLDINSGYTGALVTDNGNVKFIAIINNLELFPSGFDINDYTPFYPGESGSVLTLYSDSTPVTSQQYINSHPIGYLRIKINKENVRYNSDQLAIYFNAINGQVQSGIKLEKYIDYTGAILRDRIPYFTLKWGERNPLEMYSSKRYYVFYEVSRAAEKLYLDAKDTAKENARPKISYELEVSNVPDEIRSIELGQLVYTNDWSLSVQSATGYISSITFSLDNPKSDKIEIKNYKTTFEDLFGSISATNEAMKNNMRSYDLAAAKFDSDGTINGDILQRSISQNNIDFRFSTTNISIDDSGGIVLTNDLPYSNGVRGQVALRGGGIYCSNQIDEEGQRIWSSAITPDGINAELIRAGQIDTNKIRIFNGDDVAFIWNGEGIFAYKDKASQNEYVRYNKDGLALIQPGINDEIKRVEVGWDGFTLRNKNNEKVLWADPDTGNLTLSGTLESSNYVHGIIGSGWHIDQSGYAEFNDVFVRGTLSSVRFEYNTISAVNGSLYISPGFGMEWNNTDVCSITSDNKLQIPCHFLEGKTPVLIDGVYTITEINGRDWKNGDRLQLSGHASYSNNGTITEYVIKNWTMILVITSNTVNLKSVVNYNVLPVFIGGSAVSSLLGTITVNKLKFIGEINLTFTGSNGLRKGILLTAQEENSPYIDIYNDTNNINYPRVRLGNLNDTTSNIPSIGGIQPSGYGLFSDNAFLKGTIVADHGKIGSWLIDANGIYHNNYQVGVAAGRSDNLVFWAGATSSSTIESAPFRVYNDGSISIQIPTPDPVEIGVVNLLINSDVSATNNTSKIIEWETIENLIEGETYTFSIDITPPSAGNITYQLRPVQNQSSDFCIEFTLIGNFRQIIHKTFTFNDYSLNIPSNLAIYRITSTSSSTTIHRAKLERGNVYTDWSSTVGELINTGFEVRRNGEVKLSAAGKMTFEAGSELHITAEQIKLTASSSLDTLINNFNESIGNLNDSIDDIDEEIIFLNGKKVSSVQEKFSLHTNSTTAPTGPWSEILPSPTSNKPYIWSKFVITFADNTIRETTPTAQASWSTAMFNANSAEAWAESIRNGTAAVPKVETTGITIGPNLLTIASSANINIVANGSICLGTISGGVLSNGILLNDSGITVASGAGINMRTGGTFNIHALDDNGSIVFGTDKEVASFSVGGRGQLYSKAVFTETLETESLTIKGESFPKIIVASTEPTGSNLIWLLPTSTSKKTITVPTNERALNIIDESGYYSRDYQMIYTGDSYLPGNKIRYGINVQLYVYNQTTSTSVQLRASIRDENSSTWILIANTSARVKTGDYVELNTSETLSEELDNILSSTGGKFYLRLETNLSSSRCRLSGYSVPITIKNSSTSSASLCSVYYKP